MKLAIKPEDAWRYNRKQLNEHRHGALHDDIQQFETALNKYVEITFNWENNMSALMSDISDSASRASANQAMDDFNRTRSQYHNQLIHLTTSLDKTMVANTGERFCTFPANYTQEDLKRPNVRTYITDAAFSYYAQTHPNDRLDDPALMETRKTDEILKTSLHGINFATDTKQIQKQFNQLKTGIKMVTFKGQNSFIDTTNQSLKVYTPYEAAVELHEKPEFNYMSNIDKATALTAILYADTKNSVGYLKSLSNNDIITSMSTTVNDITGLLGDEHTSPDIVNDAKIMVQQLETNHNNYDVLFFKKHSLTQALDNHITDSLNDSLSDLSKDLTDYVSQ